MRFRMKLLSAAVSTLGMLLCAGPVPAQTPAQLMHRLPACPPQRHLKYPSPDRCLSLQLASAFVLQPRDQVSR